MQNAIDSNAIDDVDNYAESLLSCPVCLERFDEDIVVNGRRAKSLPDCRHTFCLPCLRRCCESASSRGVGDFVTAADRRRDFAGRSFPCPTCRRTCRVPDVTGGLDALPNDFRIAQVRELIDRMRKATSAGVATKMAAARRAQAAANGPQCSVCQLADDPDAADDRQAKVRCSTCDRDFCRRCADRHANSAVFRDHVTQTIVRSAPIDDQLGDDNDDDDGKWKCLEHGEPFGYYCARCERPVCTACIINVAGGHDQHPVTARDESAAALAVALADRLANIKRMIEAIESARESTVELRSRRSAMYKEAIDDIQRSAAEARQLIDTVEKELVSEAQRLNEEDDRSIANVEEKLESGQRKFVELSDAVDLAIRQLGQSIDVSRQQPTSVLRGFRRISQLIRSSGDTDDADGTGCHAFVRVPSVPDDLCRGMVMMSDVFVRIGNVERKKILISANGEAGKDTAEKQTHHIATANRNDTGSTGRQSAAVPGASSMRQSTTVVENVVRTSSSPHVERENHDSNQPRSRPDNYSDDSSSSQKVMSSIARLDLVAKSPTVAAAIATNANADNQERRQRESGNNDGDKQRLAWKSDSLNAARGVCFIDRGELVVADCPADTLATGGDLWSSATRARSSGASSVDRVKVFDCTGAVVRRLTGSVVTEPWNIGFDPTTNGGGSLIVTDRASTAIKILKMTLSFRDLTLWRPASVIKPNAIGVLTTDSNSSMYVLTDAARQSSSRISLHVPTASRIARLRTFDVVSESSSTGCGLNFIAVDRCRRILVTDSETGNISAYDVDGRQVMTFAHGGYDEGAASSAGRMVPQGIAVDAANNILVADQSGCCVNGDGQLSERVPGEGRILKFSADGRFVEVVRSWTTSDGGRPWGLAYNDEDKMLAVTTDTGLRVYRM